MSTKRLLPRSRDRARWGGLTHFLRSGSSKVCYSPGSTGGHQLPVKVLGPSLPSTQWAGLPRYRFRDLLKEPIHQAHAGARGWGPKEKSGLNLGFYVTTGTPTTLGKVLRRQHVCPLPQGVCLQPSYAKVLQMLDDDTQKRESRNDPPPPPPPPQPLPRFAAPIIEFPVLLLSFMSAIPSAWDILVPPGLANSAEVLN